MRVTILAAALMLAGFEHLPEQNAVSRGGETITYKATRCYGTCPAYTITIGPDGQGIFDGTANTAFVGEKRFKADPNQMRAFTSSLARIRPADGRDFGVEDMVKLCEHVGTDAPSVSVAWHGASGSVSLSFYYGFTGKKADLMAATLRSAPTLLPIADLIGPH